MIYSFFQLAQVKLANLWPSDGWEWAASIKFIGGEEMGIDFFPPPFSVFYECVPPFLTFPGLLFTRQVLVSRHKSNEELLKCTTGTDPCKDHQQPSSAFTSCRGESVGGGGYRNVKDSK